MTALQTRLDSVEARSGVHADFHTSGNRRLPLPLETELYRIAQEALTNVVRHARAKRVKVSLNLEVSQVCLEIQDDGVGFETAVDHSGGMGLRGIQERVEKIGGDLLIQSTVGKGTILHITVKTKQ